MFIGGFLKFSLIDYPQKISAVIFTQGCNFCCPYCHNPELVPIKKQSKISEAEILRFLRKRKNQLQAVVITGGEPTIQKDLINFIKKIKLLGYKVKLDTNGSHSDILKNLIKQKLVDYLAMDLKCPFKKFKIFQKDKIQVPNSKIQIKKSIRLIMNSGLDYEFRTTVVKDLLNKNDLIKIAKMIKDAQLYVLQKFQTSKHLNKKFLSARTYSNREFLNFQKVLSKFVKKCEIR